MSRALRRHHEERVKAKFRRKLIYYDSIGKWYSLSTSWKGKLAPGDKGRREWLQEAAVRLAHHRPHFCQLCKRPRYDRKKVKVYLDEE